MNQSTLRSLVIKSKNQLDKIKKNELIDIIHGNKEFEDLTLDQSINDSIEHSINFTMDQRLDDFKLKLEQMELNIINKLTEENQKLTKKVNELESVNSNLVMRLVKLESDHWETNQYNRRNNIEIAGIPDSVEIEDLESKVCEILDKIDVHIEDYDIQACHRLKNSQNQNKKKLPKRTIVRFINRKISDEALLNRKKLKDINKCEFGFADSTKLYINDNLCPYYKGIYGKLSHLKGLDRIHSFWSWKGCLNYKLSTSN